MVIESKNDELKFSSRYNDLKMPLKNYILIWKKVGLKNVSLKIKTHLFKMKFMS